MFDVAVIGAGPSGSMLARLLAEKRYSVALLEEHQQPGNPVNCSGIIGVEAFDRFDLPKEEIIRPIQSFRFSSPRGNVLCYRHPKPLALAVHRARFDVAMAQRAKRAGALLMTDSRVTQIKIESDRVLLTINGRDNTVCCRFVVIATGAGSRLTAEVGISGPKSFVMGAQMEAVIRDLQDVEIYFGRLIAPSNFAWVIPMQDGHAKIGLISEQKTTSALRKFLTHPCLADRINETSEIRCSMLPLGMISKPYCDRILVVGEAAGQIKVTTCGGIYYGLLAAEIASDVLHKALQQNVYSEKILAEYNARCQSLLNKELQTGLHLRSFFGQLPDSKIDALFDIASKDGIMDLIREKANFDWHHDLIYAIFRHSMIQALFQPLRYGKLLFHEFSKNILEAE